MGGLAGTPVPQEHTSLSRPYWRMWQVSAKDMGRGGQVGRPRLLDCGTVGTMGLWEAAAPGPQPAMPNWADPQTEFRPLAAPFSGCDSRTQPGPRQRAGPSGQLSARRETGAAGAERAWRQGQATQREKGRL